MIKAVLIDDDKITLEIFERMLNDIYQGIEVIGKARSAKEGAALIKRKKPDLVFLDIEMPGGNGFSMLEEFDDIDFEVVFVTSHDEYAIKAIKFSALDYIVKPVKKDELNSTIKRFLKNKNKDSAYLRHEVLKDSLNNELPLSHIVLPSAKEYKIVRSDDLYRCESDSYYTNVFLKNGEKVIVSKTLKEFEQMLTDDGFVRVHNSHLVNINYVNSFNRNDGGFVMMKDGTKIPVSRRKRENLLTILRKNKG